MSRVGVTTMEYEGARYFERARRRPPVPPPVPARSPWLWLAMNLAWICLGVAAFAVLTAALSFGVGVKRLVGFMSPALALIVLAAIAALMNAIRRGQARRVILYLHQAVRLNLPIPDLVAAAEAGERGVMRLRLRRLRQLVTDGVALGYAVELAAPGVPRRHITAIVAGEHLGRLPEALDRIAADGSNGDDAASAEAVASQAATRLQLGWYPVLMLVFLGSAINMFMIFVMPKFERILHDFDLPMPAVTAALIRLWSGWVGVFMLALPIALLAVYCGRTLARIIAPRWASVGSGFQIADRLAWWTPVVRSVVRVRGLADGLHVAADALGAGATLQRALAEAATVPDNFIIRRQFGRWAASVEQGAPAPDAARAAGMPQLVSGMVASGVGAGQLGDVMRFLARYYDARASRMAAALQGAAVPALSLVFGAAVCGLVLSVFMPLVRLIDFLTGKGFQ